MCNKYGSKLENSILKKGVSNLKRLWLAFVLLAFCVLPMLAVAVSPGAKASPTASLDLKINHIVEIRDGGLLVINDTARLSAKPGESVTLANYTLGFPYNYKTNLDYAFAYPTSDPTSKLKLELDASMGKIGFYGANTVFSQDLNINDGGSYEFTVVFVFSGSITLTSNIFNASFPAYPSLIQTASEANVKIVVPTGFNSTQSSFENQGINFTKTVVGSKQYFTAPPRNLTEFSDAQGWFAMRRTGITLQLLKVNEVKRNIEFIGMQQMTMSDSYAIVRNDSRLNNILVNVPKDALNVSAYDELGQISSSNVKTSQGTTHTDVSITFTRPTDAGKEALFSVYYQLPWQNYVSTQGWNDFHVSLTLFENLNWTIRKLTITITMPEGATLTSSALSTSLDSVQNSPFRSSLTFVFQNATPFQTASFDFNYRRSVFWESYYPTMWMSSLVIIACAIASVWRVSKPTAAQLPTAMIHISAEEIRRFVELYDEKRGFQREIESLEAQARKGKIPRRQYRVRKTTIESRMASISRDLKGLEQKIRTAGPRYNDLMRQIEVSESELQGVEADINRTEIRYRRGEISAAAYNKLLEDNYRRRDRATTTIDGVLLRLREETV